MNSHLLVSVLGRDRPDLVQKLATTTVECGCGIESCSARVLHDEFAATLLIRGNWSTLARLELALRRCEQEHGLTLITRRIGASASTQDLLPYLIEVVTLDRSEVLPQLSGFFADRNLSIAELSTRSEQPSHSTAQVLSVSMTVGVPASVSIASLRDDFFDFCEQLNVDAVMEPVRK